MSGGKRWWFWKRQIPEVSSPFGKAVEVLDTLNSLNTRSRSSPGRLGGGQKVSILAFEVANTIAKGAILMQSLSEKNLHFLKKEVLHSDGIQRLVSTDIYELLNIVAADKREEFVVIFKEVVRFGDLCKDPQWHNLCRCFNRFDWNATSWDSATLMPLKKEAETIMQHLVNLAQYTYELYHELQALDRTVQNYNWKLQEEATLSTAERGKNLMLLRHELHELKNQRKLVKSLKKKSLWSSNLEEVVEKLVGITFFLHKEILEAFGRTGINFDNCKPDHTQRLGALGLAFHYANVIGLIDSIASQPVSPFPSTRDTLYDVLPITVKSDLRSRLQSVHVKEELTVALIKSEMQKILQWLFPMADSTILNQRNGWIGEWANMSIELNYRPAQQDNVIRIQTLHYADKKKTDEYILQLVVWLHHLVGHYGSKTSQPVRCSSRKKASLSLETQQDVSSACHAKKPTIVRLSEDDRTMLERVSSRRLVPGISKSHEFIITNKKKKGRRAVQSSSNSPNREILL